MRNTLEIALNSRGSDTLGQHARSSLHRPGDQQRSWVFAQFLCDFDDGWVVNGTVQHLEWSCINR